MAISSFAQELPPDNQKNESSEEIQNLIIAQLLTQVGPITAAIVGIGIDYLRRRGIQISAEAEEYFVNSISSSVANQSRWIYEELRDNKAEWTKKDREKNITEERAFPKSLGEQAKMNVINQLKEMLISKEFTSNTREVLSANMGQLVEIAVTQNNKKLTERGRKLIHGLAPVAVDSLLLPLKSKDEAIKKRDEIIKSAMQLITNNFNFEEIQFDKNFAEMFVRSELYKKIGKVAA